MPLTLFKFIYNVTNKITHIPRAFSLKNSKNFVIIFLGTNRPEGWVRTDLKWV